MPEDLCACDQSAAVDLDAWRAEAGEAVALDARATIGPWRVTTTPFIERERRTEEVCDLVNDTWVVTDHHLSNYCDDADFIAAARTGWPRDAARVARLCDEVATLRAALGEALDELDSALSVATGVCAMTSECRARDRLRALLSDDFMRLDPS